MAQYAWLVPVLPAVSALIIWLFGTRLAKGGALVSDMGRRLRVCCAVARALAGVWRDHPKVLTK